jgi:hypothetical protein
MKRKSISKKLRFEIFKRDQFVCQYCGSHPPSVILHVDHIIPVKEGGENDMDNLITSCATCNLGKSANLLTSIPLSLKEKSELVKESEAQIKAYSKVMQDKKDRLDYEMWKVAATIEGADYIKQYNRADLKTIEVFLQRLEFNDVIDAAELAYSRFVNDDYSKFKYFCGICWNRIKGDNHG